MRQVVLDTETTGLSVDRGHRIIEIGCVELVERRRTGNELHLYLNPERAIDEGAQAVHGISEESLRDKPRFAEVADQVLAFLHGAELVIHNADFDLAFLDYELSLLGAGHGSVRDLCAVLDTLKLARERYPGQRNNLDALCKRLEVDASHRRYHGALLDAQLLADVYLAMSAGQGALVLAHAQGEQARSARARSTDGHSPVRLQPAAEADCLLHEARLDAIARACKGEPVWRRAPAV